MQTPTKISTIVLVCLLFGAGSCSRDDDFQSGDKLLQVNVQMASSLDAIDALTRGATTSPIMSDTVDMGNDLVLLPAEATCAPTTTPASHAHSVPPHRVEPAMATSTYAPIFTHLFIIAFFSN